MENMSQVLVFLIGMPCFGITFSQGGDIVMVRLPSWLRRILYIVDIKRPALPLCSVIYQIGFYSLLIFLLFCYIILSAQEFLELTTVVVIMIITPVTFTTLMYSTVLAHTNIFRIERAINLHFDRKIWLSSSRKIFEDKYKYAEKRMKNLMELRKITIKTGIEIFGKQTFKHTKETPIPKDGRIPVAHWYKYDALTGREVYFIPRQCYFYAPKLSGLIAEIENEIRDKWKYDTEKKKEFWKYRWKFGKSGSSTSRWNMG